MNPLHGVSARLRRARTSVALAATALVAAGLGTGLVAPSATATPGAAAPGAGFVTRSGTQLLVDGHPWHFAGYNLPCAQPFLLNTSQLDYYFSSIKKTSRANVVRMWFFQSDLGPASNRFGPFDTVVDAAQANGIKIIPTLTNEWDTCDEPSPPHSERTLDWYQSGYTQPEGGYRFSYKEFATELAYHFAGNPTIAFWQLVNESEAPEVNSDGTLSCNEGAAASALRSFTDNMTKALHSVDPNHLVNLGTLGMGQCGTGGNDYGYVQAGGAGLCEVHDYNSPQVPLNSGVASDIAQCKSLHKPTFVGESGIPANVAPDGTSGSAPVTDASLAQRAAFFKGKIDAADADGAVGYVIWFDSPFYDPELSTYDVGAEDPTEAVLPDALAIPSS